MSRPAVALLLAAFLVLGCASGPPERSNIVLVVLCSLRLAHTPMGGYDRPTTPFLAELAAGGTSFDHAVSASSWTKPATASLLTGLSPNVHGLWDRYPMPEILKEGAEPNRILSANAVTLAEALGGLGYATAARVNNVNAGEFFHLTQGFDDAVTRHRMRTPEILDELAAYLEGRDRERPFFFLLFTRDAHNPYSPDYESYLRFHRSSEAVPAEAFLAYRQRVYRRTVRKTEAGEKVRPELRRRFVDVYDAGLARLDRDLARLPGVLADAGVDGRTVVVVTADHGEHFFEPDVEGIPQLGHGGDLSETLLHVPLLFHGPGIPSGQRLPEVVRSIDLYPTLLELAGGEPPAWLMGRSLLARILGGAELRPEPAFASRGGAHHALRLGRYKLDLWAERRALYDVAADPLEQQNLLRDRPGVARGLHRELGTWLERERKLAELFGPDASRQLTPEMIENLRSLGYL